jgi:hypothetical protein
VLVKPERVESQCRASVPPMLANEQRQTAERLTAKLTAKRAA